MNQQYIRGLFVDWDEMEPDNYVREIPALCGLEELEFSSPITFFVGENGSGKSTLLEAMAVAAGFNPEGGSRNYHFSTHDSHSPLYQALRLRRGPRRPDFGYFLRAESFFNVATQEESYADIGHPSQGFHQMSHGESFLSLLQSQLEADGLYLLDEPEAALSPQRQLTLLAEMYNHAKCGAQFIVVSHSPILLGTPGAQILTFDEGRVHPCRYEETESYRVTELFINGRERLLPMLLGREPLE